MKPHSWTELRFLESGDGLGYIIDTTFLKIYEETFEINGILNFLDEFAKDLR